MINNSKEITVQACKFDGTIHRSWKAFLIKAELSLIVLEGFFDIAIEHPSLGLIKKGTRSIEYYWSDRWYNIFVFYQPDGTLRDYYCNINLPPKFDGKHLIYIDLDLDVLVSSDMKITLLDEEEFKVNSALYNYPKEVLQNIKSTMNELMNLIEKREFPFQT